jgi:hypothetical protein
MQLSEAKLQRLRSEALPLLWQARRQWAWIRWCLHLGSIVVPLGTYLVIVHFVLKEVQFEKYVEALVFPALVGVSHKIWTQGSKLSRISWAIQVGSFEALAESVQNLDFTFGKTSQLVSHVEQILAQPD